GQYQVEDEETATARYRNRLETGQWRAEEYPPPPYKFPEGIETPRTLVRLTERLLERGFGEEDIRKVLGLNWMRVYRQVWHG
ncbi:MAG: membrane dipeptidase, partial [Rickettsiales bacterium]